MGEGWKRGLSQLDTSETLHQLVRGAFEDHLKGGRSEGWGIPMSHVEFGNSHVIVSNLGNDHVTMLNLRNDHVTMSNLGNDHVNPGS